MAPNIGQANAGGVNCGGVITQNTKLQSDLLDCPGDGIVIGADGITLNLNGHTISTSCPETGCPGRVGIDNSGGYDRVRIRNGTITASEVSGSGFEQAVVLVGAAHNTLANLNIRGGGFDRYGSNSLVLLHSNDNVIKRSHIGGGDPGVLLSASDQNKISRSSISGGISIRVGEGLVLLDGSDHNTIVHSTVGASGGAMFVGDSRGNRIAWNDIGAYAGALFLEGAQRTVVAHNTLREGQGWALRASDSNDNMIRYNHTQLMEIGGNQNLIAYNVTEPAFSRRGITITGGDSNRVRENSAESTFDGPGIRVAPAATRTLVVGNQATGYPGAPTGGSDGDGIRVEAPGTLIRANIATNNPDLGIDAVAGVIDGGGNHASSNGNPLQCANVLCAP